MSFKVPSAKRTGASSKNARFLSGILERAFLRSDLLRKKEFLEETILVHPIRKITVADGILRES
ncbi:MAG TPA: hypothetical protein DCP92_00255 [Nitrospiraceae bacterium]|nr:hypothetical protein [Nitrospiraceae bacterium]